MPKHDLGESILKQKSHAKIAGKKGKERIKAFLDNLIEDATAFRQNAESMTKEEILVAGDTLIATMTRNADEFAQILSS